MCLLERLYPTKILILNSKTLCKDIFVEKRICELPTIRGYKMSEYFVGNVKMKESHKQKYLGDILSSDGSHTMFKTDETRAMEL